MELYAAAKAAPQCDWPEFCLIPPFYYFGDNYYATQKCNEMKGIGHIGP